MKKFWMVPAFLIVVAALMPRPSRGQVAAYNTASHLAYCTTRTDCLHEIGHALDQRAHWVSQSADFAQAVELYLYVEFRKSVLAELPARILEATYRANASDASIKRELYAALFQFADGDRKRLPVSLRLFFDWTLGQQFIDQLTERQVLYWFY